WKCPSALAAMLTACCNARAGKPICSIARTPSFSPLPWMRLNPRPLKSDDFLGVDLGIIQLATTSDGEFLNYSAAPKHAHINQVRACYSRFRAKLQKKGTKSAKRLLKKRSGREKRFAKDVNHCLSKALVSTAKGTGRGIALEDLTHIRSRVNGS